MTRLFYIVAIVWGLVLVSEPALASCTTQTVWLPDGRVMVCQVCSNGSTVCM